MLVVPRAAVCGLIASLALAGAASASAAMPTITKLSPASGPVGGGTTVTITGTELFAASAVHFGSLEATSLVVLSASKIRAVSPAKEGGVAGVVDVTVTTPEGTSAITTVDRFTYKPTVTGISPTAGPANKRTLMTVTGSGFAPSMTFGFVPTQRGIKPSPASCPVTTECSFLGPVRNPSTAEVRAIVGSIKSKANPAVKFTWANPAVVTEVSPLEGPAEGGTTVTITGTNFTGASAVNFGESPAASFTVNSSTSITAASPPGTGVVDVTVTTTPGTSALKPSDHFTYN